MAKKEDKSKEIEELKQKADSLENQLKRVLADYQNLEKRTHREKHEWVKIANKELLLRLLPVLDTLYLAQNHIKDQGIDLSIKQFLDVLKLEGVEKIETYGHEFNPKLMECVETVEGEKDKVMEEVTCGYTLNGEVLRAARVKVGKKEKEEALRQVQGKQEEELAKEELKKGDYV